MSKYNWSNKIISCRVLPPWKKLPRNEPKL